MEDLKEELRELLKRHMEISIHASNVSAEFYPHVELTVELKFDGALIDSSRTSFYVPETETL